MADFPEKVIGGISKGFRTLGSKSKEFLAVSKIRGEIRNIEASIQNKFESLGKKIYGMVNKGMLNEEEIKKDCEEISLLFKKITELEEEIKRTEKETLRERYGEEVILCPTCKAPNKSGDKFCNRCGSSLIIEIKQGERRCPSCNTLLQQEAKFCSRCGKKVA